MTRPPRLLLGLALGAAALLAWQGPVWWSAWQAGSKSVASEPVSEWELAELRRQCARSADLVTDTYDEAALAQQVAQAGVALSEAQAGGVLPLLYEHLQTLRGNLLEALAAAEAGVPAAQRRIHHLRAAQAHGAMQRRLRQALSPQDAQALFDHLPSMLPPLPGRVPARGQDSP